jgi:hypothetical protein
MVYMSEIALPQFRGALLAAFSMAFALGQVFLALGLKVLEETEPMEFRRMFYSEFVFTGLWLISMVAIPESPGSSARFIIFAQLTVANSLVLYEREARGRQKSSQAISRRC